MQLTKTRRGRLSRVCQGDIIRDVECVEYVAERRGIIEVAKITFPLVIVLTQDCDLEQDYKIRDRDAGTKDKWLISVLVAPLYNAEHVYTGEHLSELNIRMEPVPRKGNTGNFLRNNERPRYHYLEFPADVAIVPAVIDFKHYFSVNSEYLRRRKRETFVCRISELFREDISQRFAAYLSRVGLPDLAPPAVVAPAAAAVP